MQDIISSGEQLTEQPSRKYMVVAASIVGFMLIMFGIVPLVLLFTQPHFHSTEFGEADQTPIAHFELQRSDGSGKFTPEELDGTVTIYYFGYTSCPDVCPQMLFDIKRTVAALDDRADEVAVVFITIDPETDTPEKMRAYLDAFNEDFIGLYGTMEEIQPVLDDFNVRVLRADEGDLVGGGYTITHSTSAFVIDRSGNRRLRMGHAAITELTNPEDMARDLRVLLREKPRG